MCTPKKQHRTRSMEISNYYLPPYKIFAKVMISKIHFYGPLAAYRERVICHVLRRKENSTKIFEGLPEKLMDPPLRSYGCR